MTSSGRALPKRISFRLNRGWTPSMMSTLASPRSQSTTRTFRPCAARVAARLTVTKVLPTPPLPLVTVAMMGLLLGLCVIFLRNLEVCPATVVLRDLDDVERKLGSQEERTGNLHAVVLILFRSSALLYFLASVFSGLRTKAE